MDINQLVIEKVMGWEEIGAGEDVVYLNVEGSNLVTLPANKTRFSPATSIEDAWMVLDKVCEENNWRAIIDRNQNQSEVSFKNQSGGNIQHYGIADTTPMAICLAVLESVGIEVDSL